MNMLKSAYRVITIFKISCLYIAINTYPNTFMNEHKSDDNYISKRLPSESKLPRRGNLITCQFAPRKYFSFVLDAFAQATEGFHALSQ